MRRSSSLLAFLLLLALAVWVWSVRSAAPSSPPPAAMAEPAVIAPVRIAELDRLIDQARRPGALPAADMERAVTLAVERKERMRQWIATDSRQALAQAVSLAEYEALPEPLKPWFERPFSSLATLRVLPVCGVGVEVAPMRVLEMDGASWDASVHGWREGQITKENTPLAGITLDGLAAISEHAFTAVAAEEVAAHAGMPLGNPDPARDFATGQPLGKQAVTALAAGKRYLFADHASLDDTNRRMAELDASVSPTSGSNLVFALPSPADGGIDWPAISQEVELQADAWTETPKSVFCIRTDFSDVPGETVSQATLANVMNGAVADSISEMSYGKTTINADVSATTVRLPQPSTFYLPSGNSALHTDAKNAYLAIAGASALDGYDIVVVHFPSIGMASSGGVVYAGLAGGGNHWLQGTTSSGVIIHEFGHNYGIGHSSFWSTTDGSVTGTGSSVEYGDMTDIMGSGPDPEGHFHMQAKQRLSWLGASQWENATTSGVRRIYRFDSADTTGTLRGVRVAKATSPAEYYWIGYRPGLPQYRSFQSGAYLVWQRPNESRSWLIDTTPGTADGKDDAAVAIGRTFSDPAANVHITPLGKGGAAADQWLDVNVQVGPFPGNAAPTATLAAGASAAARAEVAMSASASDGNGDTLAYHWDFGDGNTGSNTSAVTHRWLVGGSYTVTLTVSDMKGGTVVKTQVVTVSDPLDSWTSGNVGASRTVNRSAYLDGRFVVTGNQYAYSSFDGTSWDAQYLGLNFRSGGMAFGNGTHVIAGHDFINGDWRAVVFRSPDGFHWTQAALPELPELRDIAWGAGAFVAVGDDGTILRSTDGGQSWTSASSPAATSLRGITYGGGLFVAVGGTSVFTSPDGLAWTDRSGGHSLPGWQSFDEITYAAGKFIAGGWYSGIHASTDGGVSWTETSIRGGHEYEIQSIVAGDGCIVAGAIDQDDGDTPVLLVSIDGLSWQESNFAGFPNTDALDFGNGRFLTAHGSAGATLASGGFFPGNGSPSASISAAGSANARASVTFTANTSDPEGDPLILAWDFKDGSPLVSGSSVSHVFSVGGSYSVDLIATDTRGGVTIATHAVTITDPLDTWTLRTSGTTADLNDIVFGGGKLLAVGESGGTYRTSTDGITWTGGSMGSNIYLEAVIHDGSQFVAAGQDYNFSAPVGWTGAIYTSPDGTTWTRRHFSGAPLQDVSHAGGVYVAVGQGGIIWRSTNATTWSPVPSGIAVDLNGIAHGNGGFVAVGSAGNGGTVAVLTSSDGSSWTNTSGGAGVASWQGFYDVEYCHDRFLASGWYSKIRHSTDGGATFASNETGTREVPAFAHGNGIFLAAGIDKDNANADINLISTDGANWTAVATSDQDDRRAAVFFQDTFITVGANGSIYQSAAFSAPPSSTGYAAWLAANFPGSPPLSGAGDDFDGDGSANLIEYATGTDPRDGDDWPGISHVVQGGQLILTVVRDPAATDVTITGKKSGDLGTWTSTGVTILEDSATQFRAAIPVAAGKSFLRAEFAVE